MNQIKSVVNSLMAFTEEIMNRKCRLRCDRNRKWVENPGEIIEEMNI